ncbi:Gfo/Idh/MocA family protein [Pseudactinotalea suaedae]|uniref:Gfo/Idh/MocA family protein n=1 Tax=Pseudactinotalea suaedae TaxID=1524924 RepID=UPI0012E1584F|nr:Gfo/Idh/MocA family oxidoreductase [Pseudactinotalea suaedae]
MTGRPIGVGVIGLGNSGWYYHAEGTLERSSDYDIVAVSARRRERTAAGAQRFAARGHDDWRDLVKDESVDVVVVATPHDQHAPMTLAALAAGKHVVVEKPMASTPAETEAMLAAADEHQRILTVFQNRRWEPSFQIIRTLLADGAIGDVWRSEERRMHRGKYTVAGVDRAHAGTEPAAWAHSMEGGGGVVNLIAPHLVDHQLLLHGGLPRAVTATMHRYPQDDVEHHGDLRLDYGDGVAARIEVFRECDVNLPKWSVFGSSGTIVADDFDELRLIRPGRDDEVFGGLAPLQACGEFYEQLARAVRDEGPVPVDPRQAADVVRVLDAAHRSAASGGALVAP